jgi:hypothetical protein
MKHKCPRPIGLRLGMVEDRLEGLLIESDEEALRAATDSLSKKDYKRLARAHLRACAKITYPLFRLSMV